MLSENKSLKCNEIYLLRPDLSLRERFCKLLQWKSFFFLLPVYISKELSLAEQLLTKEAGKTGLGSAFPKVLQDEMIETSNLDADGLDNDHHVLILMPWHTYGQGYTHSRHFIIDQ